MPSGLGLDLGVVAPREGRVREAVDGVAGDVALRRRAFVVTTSAAAAGVLRQPLPECAIVAAGGLRSLKRRRHRHLGSLRDLQRRALLIPSGQVRARLQGVAERKVGVKAEPWVAVAGVQEGVEVEVIEHVAAFKSTEVHAEASPSRLPKG